jgi:hypothetical protein
MAKFQVWYMRPEWFREGSFGKLPDRNDLLKTHVPLKSVAVENGTPNPLQYVFHMMQGEIWSPNGEARALIKSKGLEHTSMSVGDVIVDENGRANIVASFGFEELR